MLIDVAIVVVDPENPLAIQETYKTWLESKDYVNSVTYEAYDVSQATLNTYDVVIALSSGAVCKGLSVPVLGSWATNYVGLKLGTAGGSASGLTAINITDNTHYITEVFGTGNLTVFSESGSIRFTRGNSQDVIDLAERVGDSDDKQLLYLEKDGLHVDETVCTERIVFFGVGGDVDILTEDAETLFERIFGWLMYEDFEQVATPTFEPAEGTYTEAQDVVISCATDGATIKYTIDGSTPTPTHGTEYTEAVNIGIGTTTLKAIAYKDGMSDSDVATGVYIIGVVPSKLVVEWDTPITMEVDFKTPITKEVDFDTPIVKEVTWKTPLK